MNASFNAQQGYAATQSPIRTSRSTEVQLLGQITSQLKKAVLNKSANKFSKLAEALHRNRRMWTHFAAEVADDNNALPDDLRARLFYLAEFTNVHTAKVLAGEAKADALIEINSAVMRGLSGNRDG